MACVAVRMRGGVLLVCGALSLACVGRTVPDDSDAPTDEDAPEDEDIDPRPDEGMYAACSASAQCSPLDFCVFPSDEDGYCTDVCSSPEDPTGLSTPEPPNREPNLNTNREARTRQCERPHQFDVQFPVARHRRHG